MISPVLSGIRRTKLLGLITDRKPIITYLFGILLSICFPADYLYWEIDRGVIVHPNFPSS